MKGFIFCAKCTRLFDAKNEGSKYWCPNCETIINKRQVNIIKGQIARGVKK